VAAVQQHQPTAAIVGDNGSGKKLAGRQIQNTGRRSEGSAAVIRQCFHRLHLAVVTCVTVAATPLRRRS
jgi:DNA-binding NtrC family response regulator